MTDQQATERMTRFWCSDELEWFAAKANAVAFPYGLEASDNKVAAERLRNATAEIYDILADGFTDEERAIVTEVPDLDLVVWSTVHRDRLMNERKA